ncbi:MAG TPA: hypothetical protein VMM58_14120 [Bacteroidota bacterium]|nr:hypothetical protein [Bacteroidota bacterium]
MATIFTYIPTLSLCVGGWAVVNGILHDAFVLRSEHGKTYDRDLLRLLMDGHILITCGTLQMIAFSGLRTKESWAFSVAGVASISIVVYCGMIFPFLKSIVTMTLNALLLVVLIAGFMFAA